MNLPPVAFHRILSESPPVDALLTGGCTIHVATRSPKQELTLREYVSDILLPAWRLLNRPSNAVPFGADTW